MTAPELDPLDLLAVDALLSPDEVALRDRVQAFVAAEVLPHIEGWFERGEFPRHLAPGFGQLGVLGLHLDGYGCPGGSAVDHGLAMREIEHGDSGLRSFASVQGSLVMVPIHRFGSEEQKQEWLPRLATGEAIGCFALTEPEAGSDPSAMTTVARRDGSDWVLTGEKKWNTNGWASDVAVVWAKDETGEVRGFLVPSHEPGVEFRELEHAWSLRAAARSELSLRDVRLPADAVLPGATGLKAPLVCLTEARFGIAWGAVGAARACFEAALQHAKTRVQFGKPIGSFQLVQRKLAEMAIAVNRASLLALHLGRMKDAGTMRHEQVSLAKLDNARAALEIAREARGLLGATGITFDAPVIRHMNNLESVVTYEGTEEIHTLVLGAALTGIRAFE
jgi:glutaryl-CoA dehydrogenase